MVIETLLATATGFILKGLKDAKGIENAKNDLSIAFWNWIKPIFIETDEIVTNKIESTTDDSLKLLIEIMLDKKRTDNNFISELEKWVEKITPSNNNSGETNMSIIGDGNNTVIGSTGVSISVYKKE